MKQLKPSLITLAILLAGLALTPYIALSSAPISWQRYAAAYLPPSTPPTSVIIAGPTTGAVNTRYPFTATASPLTVTLPLTYTWQATGQGIVVHTLITSTSDVAAFTWTMPGAIAITVTAGNAGGSATSMHTITLAAPPTNVNLAGPISGVAGMVYTFTAAASAGSTTPITYTWQATNRSPATHTSGLTDTMAWAWPSGTTGAQAITVTAGNAGGSVTGMYTITLALATPPANVNLTGPISGAAGIVYTFTAAVNTGSTTPITYTWQATNRSPATHTSGLTDTMAWAWPSGTTGAQAITVTAGNAGGSVTGTHTITLALATPPANVNLTGPISGAAGIVYTFTAAVNTGSTTPITYTWQATNRSPATHTSGLTDTMAWAWPSGTTGSQAITVTAANAVGAVTGTHLITLTTTSTCSRPLSGTRISGPTLGYTGTPYTFTAVLTPSDATLPITYTWSPAPARGQGIASASYQWVVSGVNAITLTAQNCGGTFSASHVIAVQAGWKVYLPLVLR